MTYFCHVLIETLNKEFQIHFSEEPKNCNTLSNTKFFKFLWFQSWDFEHNYANSDTIRIVNMYIQGKPYIQWSVILPMFLRKID